MNAIDRAVRAALIAASLAVAAGTADAQQPTPIKRPPDPSQVLDRVRLPEREPEPTGVYGWIAIIDPVTGERWLPRDHEYDPPRLRGYPASIDLRFEPVFGGSPVTVSFRAGAGLALDPARDAWRYSIGFDHVGTMTGPPAASGTNAVRYNPDDWRFAAVAVGEYRWSVREGDRTRVLWSVDFEPRPTTFSDLPDMPPN